MSGTETVAPSERPRTDHEPMSGGDLPAPGEAKSLSISEAAALMARRRHERQSGSEEEQPGPESDAPEETIAPDEEQPEEDSEIEGQSDGDQGEEDQGLLDSESTDSEEEEAEEQTEEEQSGPLELDDDTVLMVDGVEMTLQDIRDNGIREDDYTRKTQALSEQRETLKEREQLVGVRLGQIENAMMANLAKFDKLDWTSIANEDPARYTALRAQHDAAKQQLEQVKGETERFFTEIREAEAKATQVAATRAAAELKRLIPGWNNGMYYSLVDYAAKTGFDRKAALQFTDPNVFVVLRKAKLYDEAQKSVGKTKKVVRASGKKTLRAKAPTGRRLPSKEKQAVAKTRKQLAESGKLDDAVALLRARRAEGGGQTA